MYHIGTTIQIFNPSGVAYTYGENGNNAFPVTDSCERKAEVMGDDYVRLSFSLQDWVFLESMSFIEYDGEYFFLKDNYSPKYSDGNYVFDCNFYAVSNLFDKFLVVNSYDGWFKKGTDFEQYLYNVIECSSMAEVQTRIVSIIRQYLNHNISLADLRNTRFAYVNNGEYTTYRIPLFPTFVLVEEVQVGGRPYVWRAMYEYTLEEFNKAVAKVEAGTLSAADLLNSYYSNPNPDESAYGNVYYHVEKVFTYEDVADVVKFYDNLPATTCASMAAVSSQISALYADYAAGRITENKLNYSLFLYNGTYYRYKQNNSSGEGGTIVDCSSLAEVQSRFNADAVAYLNTCHQYLYGDGAIDWEYSDVYGTYRGSGLPSTIDDYSLSQKQDAVTSAFQALSQKRYRYAGAIYKFNHIQLDNSWENYINEHRTTKSDCYKQGTKSNAGTYLQNKILQGNADFSMSEYDIMGGAPYVWSRQGGEVQTTYYVWWMNLKNAAVTVIYDVDSNYQEVSNIMLQTYELEDQFELIYRRFIEHTFSITTALPQIYKLIIDSIQFINCPTVAKAKLMELANKFYYIDGDPESGNTTQANKDTHYLANALSYPFDFKGTSIKEALNMLAEKYDTEWYVRGGELFVKNSEYGDAMALSDLMMETGSRLERLQSLGLKSCEYKDSLGDIPMLIYPIASDRNMTITYISNTAMNTIVEYDGHLKLKPFTTYRVISGSVGRLGLNLYTTYETDAGGGIHFGLINESATYIAKTESFDDIYPRCYYKIVDVETVTTTSGQYRYNIYVVPLVGTTDTPLDISSLTTEERNRLLPTRNATNGLEGEKPSIIFEGGVLNGFEFEVVLKQIDSSDSAHYNMGYVYMQIAPEMSDVEGEEGKIKYPQNEFIPHVGDKISIVNIKMPDSYVELARQELAQAAYDYYVQMSKSTRALKCVTDSKYVYKNNVTIGIGSKVSIFSHLFLNKLSDGDRERMLEYLANPYSGGSYIRAILQYSLNKTKGRDFHITSHVVSVQYSLTNPEQVTFETASIKKLGYLEKQKMQMKQMQNQLNMN